MAQASPEAAKPFIRLHTRRMSMLTGHRRTQRPQPTHWIPRSYLSTKYFSLCMKRCRTRCSLVARGLCPVPCRVKSGNMQLSQFFIRAPDLPRVSSWMSKHQHVGQENVQVPQLMQEKETSSQNEAL